MVAIVALRVKIGAMRSTIGAGTGNWKMAADKRYLKRKAQGVCVRCGGEIVPGKLSCRPCLDHYCQQAKAHYQKNKEKILKRQRTKKYRIKARIRSKKYYANNREKMLNISKAWQKKNRAAVTAQQKAYRSRPEIAERMKIYAEKTIEHRRALWRARYKRQREIMMEKRKKYDLRFKEANPGYFEKKRKEIAAALTDSYVRGMIAHKYDMPSSLIPDSLVAEHREYVMAKRIIKKFRKEYGDGESREIQIRVRYRGLTRTAAGVQAVDC
jgi:hypothetical protein